MDIVDGTTLNGTTTGTVNVSGIGKLVGIGEGVGIVAITAVGTVVGTYSNGITTFEEGNKNTQCVSGTYLSGITTAFVNMIEVGGNTVDGTDGGVNNKMCDVGTEIIELDGKLNGTSLYAITAIDG